MVKTFNKEFEEKIIELGFSFNSFPTEFYNLNDKNGINHSLTVRLVESKPPITKIHGSKNGNKIQAIGLFKFKRIKTAPKPDFSVFTFRNPRKNLPKYLIIPEGELERRMINVNSDYSHDKMIKMVFWLMKDGSIYNTTNISIEGEWYFMSQGTNGRMADGTDWDFTCFLNGWCRLRNN